MLQCGVDLQMMIIISIGNVASVLFLRTGGAAFRRDATFAITIFLSVSRHGHLSKSTPRDLCASKIFPCVVHYILFCSLDYDA